MKNLKKTMLRKKPLMALCIGIILFCGAFVIPFCSMADETVQVPAPDGLKVYASDTDYYNGKVDLYLKWNTPSGISDVTGYDDHKYRVQVSKNQNWDDPEYDFYTWDTEYEFYSLDIGEKYYFRVQTVCYAYTYDEEGDYSDYVTIYSDWSEVANIQVLYEAPKLTSAVSAGANAVTLTWYTNTDVDGEVYYVYRSTSQNGTYSQIATVSSNDDEETLTYTDRNVKTGTTYYYKVCQYNGEMSNVLSATPKPNQLTLKANPASYKSITLTWNTSESGVTGYVIYQATSENGTYSKIKTITSRSTVTYTKKSLTIGKKYYYKIVAYSVVDGKTIYGNESKVVSAVPSVLAPKIKSIKVAAVTKAKISWKKVSGASGYIIYRATSKNGTYKKVGTVKSAKKLTYTATGLKNGKTYYFKVQAYRTVKGKKYKGVMSSVKKVLMNKLGYENESYTSRCKRIFKKSYYKKYTSEKQAKKNMVTISVKVWDINSSNHKYTRVMYLTVNKNIASTVRQIFREIYKGKEKFPIHSVGGFRWNGASSSSEHNEGLAIDINANENAQFSSDGKVLVGSCYEPGDNPYSITPNGDVVKAFAKYGFGWGYWFSRPDYMHFSYFGT